MQKKNGKRKSGHISSDSSDLDLENIMEEPPVKKTCTSRPNTRSQSKIN